MKLEKWMKSSYVYLAIYFLICLVTTPPALFYLSLIIILVASFFIFLYLYLEDEILFYTYLLFSIFIVVMPFASLREFTAMHMAVMYTFMAPLMLHIMSMHFGPYGKIMKNTYIIYLSSLPLSFFIAYMVMFIHSLANPYFVAAMALLVVLVYYYLLRDSFSKSQ